MPELEKRLQNHTKKIREAQLKQIAAVSNYSKAKDSVRQIPDAWNVVVAHEPFYSQLSEP